MQIEVERLDERGEAFSHTYGKEELSLDDETARLASEARVAGRASMKGSEVRLRGTLSTQVEVYCDRCAAAVVAPLEIEFDTSFLPAEVEKAAVENVELQKDDLIRSVYEGGAVDLDELAREQILLALPTRTLCREECRGLCPECGANLNAGECDCARKEIDPRWAALADLKKDE
ncbi:MAG TPA: DUF177 domain-containing protein [Pyrinomonadaceae bacterium]|nr:DUF177 domain-containing protein [Pyrinomonadaceae bacterium]